MYIPENDEQNQQLRSSMFSLTGTGFFGAIGRSINLGLYFCNSVIQLSFQGEKMVMYIYFSYMAGGQTALALRLLLATLSSKVSADINRPFGDEVDETLSCINQTVSLM